MKSLKHSLGIALGYLANVQLRLAANWTRGEIRGIVGRRVRELAYGENRWQSPAFLYRTLGSDDDLFAAHRFEQVFGDPAGYINETDRYRLVQTLTHIAAVWHLNFGQVPYIAAAVKHGNVCGAAVGETRNRVIAEMIDGDPGAIFGGVVMTNFAITAEMARLLRSHKWKGGASGRPYDGIVAPSVDEKAMEVFKRKDNRCRVFVNPSLVRLGSESLDHSFQFRQARGGFLTQKAADFVLDLRADYLKKSADAGVACEKSLALAWAVGSTSNSNTITLATSTSDDGFYTRIVSNAVAQQSRDVAAFLAVEKASRAGNPVSPDHQECAAYSDSFFPFPDAVEILYQGGVDVILTSSDGLRFPEVQAYCRENGIILYSGPDEKIRGFFGH